MHGDRVESTPMPRSCTNWAGVGLILLGLAIAAVAFWAESRRESRFQATLAAQVAGYEAKITRLERTERDIRSAVLRKERLIKAVLYAGGWRPGTIDAVAEGRIDPYTPGLKPEP